ncbi:MAG: hypothetical protein ACI8RZ_001157 [Myxococcota bacterium]|jgi:hypothetical protein
MSAISFKPTSGTREITGGANDMRIGEVRGGHPNNEFLGFYFGPESTSEEFGEVFWIEGADRNTSFTITPLSTDSIASYTGTYEGGKTERAANEVTTYCEQFRYDVGAIVAIDNKILWMRNSKWKNNSNIRRPQPIERLGPRFQSVRVENAVPFDTELGNVYLEDGWEARYALRFGPNEVVGWLFIYANKMTWWSKDGAPFTISENTPLLLEQFNFDSTIGQAYKTEDVDE